MIDEELRSGSDKKIRRTNNDRMKENRQERVKG